MINSIKSKKIYFLCPDQKHPTGGVKQIYRQVEILNDNGYQAYVVHRKKNFRLNWFQHEAPVTAYPVLFHELDKVRKKSVRYKLKFFLKELFTSKKKPEHDSILVYPELYAPYIEVDKNKYQKVIFNQNCYYTFSSLSTPLQQIQKSYLNEATLASIVVSKNSEEYLHFAFPGLPVYTIRIGINETFKNGYSKKKQIAYMPRKLGDDLNQIIHLISNKDFMKHWELVEINNKPESEVARILGESLIYLSTNSMEGFGLPPAEAMKCGCYVIGYAGNAGKEYFDDAYSSRVPDRDILEFAKEIKKIVTICNQDPETIIKKGALASDHICKNYNLKKERESVLEAWQNINNLYTKKQ